MVGLMRFGDGSGAAQNATAHFEHHRNGSKRRLERCRLGHERKRLAMILAFNRDAILTKSVALQVLSLECVSR